MLRFAGLNVIDPDEPPRGLTLHSAADIFRTGITPHGIGLATPLNDLFKRPDHALGRRGKIDLDAQGFAVEVIDHIEQPQAAAITELMSNLVCATAKA